MEPIGIRELQKISAEAITRLPGPTAIRSGLRTVGLLIPLRAPPIEPIARVLALAEALGLARAAEMVAEAEEDGVARGAANGASSRGPAPEG